MEIYIFEEAKPSGKPHSYRYPYYLKNKQYYDDASRRYVENHPTRKRELEAEHRREWGLNNKYNQELIIKAERFAASDILPQLGFNDIHLARGLWGTTFPFDILAKKDGKLCAIEVCLTWNRNIKPNKITFCKFLGLEPYVCHVRPSFDWVAVNKLNGKRYSSVRLPFRKWLQTKGG